MSALRDWAFDGDDKRGTGRITALAKYLDVTQAAVTKMIQSGSYQDRKHARKIMEFTRIPAKELFPFWVDIFEYSNDVQNEALMKKRKEIQERMKALQDELDVLYADDTQDIDDHLKSIGLARGAGNELD